MMPSQGAADTPPDNVATLSPEDTATLAAAFTPEVLAVLQKLSGGNSEPEGDEGRRRDDAPAVGRCTAGRLVPGAAELGPRQVLNPVGA
jgi:hypothetical protein